MSEERPPSSADELPPIDSGVDPDLLETYWKPFKYTPDEDAALCFACEEWLPPESFDLDDNGFPKPTCRSCGA